MTNLQLLDIIKKSLDNHGFLHERRLIDANNSGNKLIITTQEANGMIQRWSISSTAIRELKIVTSGRRND